MNDSVFNDTASDAAIAALAMGGNDPYLQYQPAFAYTLPIQILVSGITLTLLVMLLIHLLFTTQYHYPLAPLNYCLQVASVVTVLLGISVRIGVILRHSAETADQWPYDLDYVAVAVPQKAWTAGEEAAWYLLQAVCNGLANLTHIQFLTLLYPSRLEARLIFFSLGPLAIASSVLFFCDLSSSRTVVDLGDAIRNVFSSCLLLIFGLSLCIWGFLVNRRRAWRLDGGTGVFGMGALGLAFVTTASSFVAVKEEHIDWLQHLIWAAVLWQTWLGWWWWVGAGMGIGEVEDIMERAIRKRRKAARRAHRREVITNLTNPEGRRHPNTMAGRVKNGANNAVSGFTTGLAHFLPSGSQTGSGDGTGLTRRQRSTRIIEARDVEEGIQPDQPEDIELGSLRLREPPGRPAGTEDGSGAGRQPPSSNSETSSTSRTPSLHAPRNAGEFFSFPATWLQVYFRRLRHAHEEAAHKRAVEQAERRKRVPTIAGSAVPEDGWGLGAYGAQEHAESVNRRLEAERRLREEQLLDGIDGEDGDDDDDGDGDDDGDDHDDTAEGSIAGENVRSHSRPTSTRPARTTSRNQTPSQSRRGSLLSQRRDTSRHASRRASANRDTDVVPANEEEADWVDVFSSSDDDRPRASGATTPRQPPRRPGVGWSWWGPLQEWRLQDRSEF